MATRTMRLQSVSGLIVILWLNLILLSCMSEPLRVDFYRKSCPNLEIVVFKVMQEAVHANPRDAASILRLFFHDCFVQGCDGSILLDDEGSFQGEKGAVPNKNSARAFNVIDAIKTAVEAACPGVVSCTDILALASRDGVVLTNGPSWDVLLGRRDARSASLSAANSSIPNPASNLTTLISMFQVNGLSSDDLVVLSGAHTIGLARCVNFKQRLYNQSGTGKPDPNLSATARQDFMCQCPPSGGDNNTHQLDKTPVLFDTSYYKDILIEGGLLNSDQVLYSTPGAPTKPLVEKLANNLQVFFNKFPVSMIKLGNINPLTGSNGEIRKNCRRRN